MKKRGSVTILFAILLPVLLLFGMFVFEALWEGLAKTYFEQACYSTSRSSLADYDTSVWQDYGVFLLPEESGQARLEEEFVRNLDTNGWLDLEVTRIESRVVAPLEREVLKNQILENVKYIAPVRGAQALWDLIRQKEDSEAFSRGGDAAGELEQAQDNMEKTRKNNRRIKDDKKDIKKLKKRISDEKKTEEPDQGRIKSLERSIRSKDRKIDDMYDENRELTYETQEILAKQSLREVPPELDEEKMASKSTLQEKLEDLKTAKEQTEERLDWEDDTDDRIFSRGSTEKEECGQSLDLVSAAQDVLKDGRNRLYLGEYALKYFSNVVSDSHDAQIEYLITGANHPGAAYALRLLAVRSGLDALGYFVLDPKAPPEILARTAYSLIMGALQGLIDLYSMVGLGEAVPLIHITPGGTNPFERIQLDYEDHQRIDLLLTGEDKKLDRIQELLPAQGYTGRLIIFEAQVRRIFPFRILGDEKVKDDLNYMHLRKEIRICY
jgi:hypothetical protein